MIYEYFGNKDELYKTVLRDVYIRLGTIEQEIFSYYRWASEKLYIDVKNYKLK